MDGYDADLLMHSVGEEETDKAGEPPAQRMKVGELRSNDKDMNLHRKLLEEA